MRALQYDRVGGPVRLVTVPDPAPEPDGAIVAVTRTGLCRSDWHGWQGHDGDTALPCIPGHEFTGTVAAAPADPDLVGRRVVVPFVMACGTCVECGAGQAQVCRSQRQPGFSDPGSFAEYVAVPHARVNVVPLPDSVDDDAAAALGCRVATAWRALTAVAALKRGESVAVLGAGGVGLAAVDIATALGADVLAVDIAERPLAAAAALGAATAVIPRDAAPDVVAGAIRGWRPDGVQVTVDALGAPALAAGGVLGLARRGRHVQVGLLPDGEASVPMGRVIAHELRVLGSHGMSARDYPAMLAAIGDGRIRPGALVRGVLGLADGASALMAMDSDGGVGGLRLIDPRR